MRQHFVALVFVLGIASTANANVTLTYTGNPFTSLYSSGALPPDPYTTADRVTGTIELLAPLGASLVGVYVTPVSFSFSDGVNTITTANAQSPFTPSFQFWTDASGRIVNWAINLSTITPGVFRYTIQTINMPSFPSCGNCETDSGTNTECGPVVNCIDASGNLVIDPLYSQLARVDGSRGAWTVEETIPFSFKGFFSPVDNDPIVNKVKAGAGVPMKFSLGGNRGLNILWDGFPISLQVACDNFATLDPVEETVSAGQSGLTYDASLDQYTYVWKTQKTWGQTCRQLVLRLKDGTFHIANFNFDK